MERKFDLEDRLIDFGVQACRIAERLPSSRLGVHIKGQLIRSCTSPASNYGEAQGAESRRDFIHKLKVCLKELRETRIWLRFVEKLGLIDSPFLQPALKESNELIAVFVKSVSTAEKRQRR